MNQKTLQLTQLCEQKLLFQVVDHMALDLVAFNLNLTTQQWSYVQYLGVGLGENLLQTHSLGQEACKTTSWLGFNKLCYLDSFGLDP